MKKKEHIQKESTSKIFEAWKKNEIGLPGKNGDFTKVIDQIASTFSPGSYYYYILNFATLEFDFVHPSVEKVLGIKPQDFSFESFFSKVHPEDLNLMHEKEAAAIEFMLHKIDPSDLLNYKIVYMIRVMNEKGEYRKILHQAKPVNISDDGKIQQVIGVHTDVTFMNSPADQKISFIGLNDRPSYFTLNPKAMNFDVLGPSHSFTKREIAVIELIALGDTTEIIAEKMSISPHTVKAHKKNILKKSGAPNSMRLVADCIRDGII